MTSQSIGTDGSNLPLDPPETHSEVGPIARRDEIAEFAEWQRLQYTEGVYVGGKLPPMGVMIAGVLSTGCVLVLLGAGILAVAVTDERWVWQDIAYAPALLPVGCLLYTSRCV